MPIRTNAVSHPNSSTSSCFDLNAFMHLCLEIYTYHLMTSGTLQLLKLEINKLSDEESILNQEMKSILQKLLPLHQCEELERTRLSAMKVLSEHRSINARFKERLKCLSSEKFEMETLMYDRNFENKELRQRIIRMENKLLELGRIGKSKIHRFPMNGKRDEVKQDTKSTSTGESRIHSVRPRKESQKDLSLLDEAYSNNALRMESLRCEIPKFRRELSSKY